MKKLKAFTVLELLVAMVISSLVISASYFAYDIVYKQFLNFKQVDRNVLDALTLINVLNNDIAGGEYLVKASEGVRIVDFEGVEHDYFFGDDMIVRTVGASTDTFYLGTAELEYHQMIGESVVKGLLDKFELVIIVNGIENTLSFHKQYGADLLMLSEGAEN